MSDMTHAEYLRRNWPSSYSKERIHLIADHLDAIDSPLTGEQEMDAVAAAEILEADERERSKGA